MDLEEWDLLSDEGFIDLHENGGNNTHNSNNLSPKSIPNNTLIDMNYFQKFSDPPKKTGVVIPVPIQLNNDNNNQLENDEKTGEKIPDEEVLKFPIDDPDHSNNQESVSQVFFKKLNEKNEFVDMKMDSPMSFNNNSNKGLISQPEVEFYSFNEKVEVEDEVEIPCKNRGENVSKNSIDDDQSNEGLNVWKWAMTGIGALFSFGFAAATVSIIVLGNRHKGNCNNSKKQELHFQLYSHDKRLNQVVRHATTLNEAISAMRGAPVTRAHITIGGYHESL